MSTEVLPPPVRWDLSALFASIDDPKIEATWKEANARADAFATQYRGKIDDPALTADTLASALTSLEELTTDVAKPLSFANLLFAGDASNPTIGAFMQAQMEKATELQVKLMFFELELQAASGEVIDRLLADPKLSNYVHHVTVARTYSPYRLSEKEEVLMEEMANTGSRAWNRLFDEVTSNYVFKVDKDGETEEMSQQEVLALLRHEDRATRQAGADALTAGLKDQERVLTFIFNTMLQDKSIEDRVRGFEFAQQSRHMANELDRETVDLVVRLCREYYPMVARYYAVKRQILDLPELTHIDRYAPLFAAEEKVSWERAQGIVLDAFGEFSGEIRSRAAEFFDKNWIDAEPRKGKTGGAFCSYNTPDTHPVILQSFLNKMDDVMTLAHELGHGVHASLSRAQTYFNYHGTLPLAELASTFGEMLVFEKLVSGASTKDKLALYAEKIEGIFATVFRQAAMYQFEMRIHEARRTEGELTSDEYGEIWQEELQAMFGDSVKLGDQHRCWWMYVSHFMAVPFYVYAYSFGELLVLSLYEMAKKQGPSFADDYIEVLRLGGSKSPTELMAMVNVDLKSEAFWRGGFAAMDQFLVEFERLWAEYNA
ncbi:MAG: M3 family oligoendopeptidase [Armatimonadetes bacterium]|nr:M3 family oligoendopeptidase [Armatimonadota bacterium]MBS1702222.1 M3 family oligoendopeptidase [Armatimonadota bacterium]